MRRGLDVFLQWSQSATKSLIAQTTGTGGSRNIGHLYIGIVLLTSALVISTLVFVVGTFDRKPTPTPTPTEMEQASDDTSSWLKKTMQSLGKGRGVATGSAVPAATPAATPQPNGPPTEGFQIDRYQHDVAMAEQMRRGMQKRKKISESDVLSALNALDNAEELRAGGDLQQALKVSEMAIELLITLLKADSSVLPSVDRSTISARVQLALSEAEEIKRELQLSPRNSTSPKVSSSTTKTPSTGTSSGRLRISTMHRKNSKRSVGQPTTPTSATSPVSTPTSISKSSYTSTSTSKSKQREPSAPKSFAMSKTTPSAPKPSQFFNSQDPMVKTIKSELYVDQSQLQNTSWNDIAGLNTAKQSLQEAAILPLMRPDLFTGLRKPRNILLYGPPGTGKTMLVKAVAKESDCLLFICTASSLTSKWHGEGEKLLRTLFQVARAAAPSIIFVDEMDALLSSRKSDGEHEASRRFKTEFMTQVDGIVKDGGNDKGQHLLLIACTNCPWDIDSAVLRRFPRRIFIPLPDSQTRLALLGKLLSKAGKHGLSSSDAKEIVRRLDGFSGSDIASIASEASFGPLRSLGSMDAIRGAKANDIRPINRHDFELAIDQATKSVSKSLLKKYDEWKAEQAAG